MNTRFHPVTALIGVVMLLAASARSETYSYDNNGRLTMVDYGNGRHIFYTYDANGNLIRRNAVAFTDTDNDGMDDDLENTYFMTLDRDGSGDYDHDGVSDADEILAGTNPKDENSVFKVTTVEGVCTITWNSVAGKNYRVQYKNKLTDATWFDFDGDVTAVGATTSKTDSPPPGQSMRLYRVALLP